LSVEEIAEQVYTVPVSALFDVPDGDTDEFTEINPDDATYEADSSNIFVVTSTIGTRTIGGTDITVVVLAINSIGEADITVTATQDTGPTEDGRIEQKATTTFKVVVVS
jgi:hypothetical protein